MDIGFLVIAVAWVIGAFLVARGAGLFHRDRIYEGLPPGLTPLPGAEHRDVRVKGGQEYGGEVPVAFAPPRGLRPGLVGTVVDSNAEMRDITATIVDLAVRGHLTIRAMDETISDRQRSRNPDHAKASDWELTVVSPVPDDELSPMEHHLLGSLFSRDSQTTLKTWSRGPGPGQIRDWLYAQAVANGWYRKDPRRRGGGLAFLIGAAGVLFALLVVGANPTIWGVLSAVMIAGASVWAGRKWYGRVGRTAEGTAAMIQALGFKKYLATAEAEQFSFEEAAGIFSRYLPYAIVFGVSAHWAKTFGEVVERSEAIGGPDLLDALIWFDLSGLDTLAAHTLFSLGDGGGLFDLGGLDLGGLGDLAGGLGEITGGLGDFAEGVGDFVSGIDFDF
ncbi:DUF2207 domain-containing protein [Aestuariimicrobium ganziense]|uniref:DUF2207 domain-containing protein n=1 Tax=Aestuariimicrobium ganziense TaxID=2773677 RepID=UPI001F45B247|nr:DUF2207 domain-containing protein [Aestuariimicrobium ganziense]